MSIAKAIQMIDELIEKSSETINSNLEQIKKELVPDCTHPKEMMDNCAGQWYCMSCNLDLPTPKILVCP